MKEILINLLSIIALGLYTFLVFLLGIFYRASVIEKEKKDEP